MGYPYFWKHPNIDSDGHKLDLLILQVVWCVFFILYKDLLFFISQGIPGIHISFQSLGQLREAVSHLRSQEDQAAFDEGECEEAPELLQHAAAV